MSYCENNQTWIEPRTRGGASVIETWLFWLRYWLLGCCDYFGVPHDGFGQGATKSAPFSGRAWQRMDAYFERRALPPARNLGTLYALLPRGLSNTQALERLTQISALGRVRLYQMIYWGSALLRRAALTCYDHGWWRAPTRGWKQVPASARPP